MAIKALDLSKTRDYISKLDDGDEPTVWKIGTLSSRDVGQIRDSVTTISFKNDGSDVGEQDINTNISRSKMNFEAVRRGLKGFENYLDENGNAIHFKLVTRDIGGGVKKSVVPNEILDSIPLAVVEELAGEIMGDNMKEDGDEAGNSPEPSSDE